MLPALGAGGKSLCHSLVRKRTMQLIILAIIVLLLCYAGLILLYRKAWLHTWEQTFTNVSPAASIAIIIPARNEAENLPALLASIKQQNYPQHLLDVVVIDDHSTDETFFVAKNFSGLNIKVIKLSDHVDEKINSYKKKAIEIGIAATTSELIITTDADCIAPKNWLHSINAYYQKHTPQMLVMPVMFMKEKNALDIFQSLDFLVLQGITGAAIQNKMHAMCNGANLAYTRAAFETVNGFTGIDHIASGDDMLLLQKISSAFPKGIHYLKSKDVIVETSSMKSVTEFFDQRIRWASKAGNYKEPKIILVMLLVYIVNLSLLLFPFLFINNNYKYFNLDIEWWFLILWCIKIFSELFFVIPVAKFFNKQHLIKWFIPAQPFHIIYTIVSGTLGWFGSYNWKGRKVK